MLRGSYWPNGSRIRVAFRGGSPDINQHVIEHANAWSRWANICFVPAASMGECDVLVGYDQPGYWSLIGPAPQVARSGQTTVNLQGFDSGRMPESEWTRVVRHEFGHTLGAEHEQQRPEVVARLDPAKCYAYFAATQGWDRATVDAQILAPLDMAAMDETASEDDRSIMMYWFDGRLTKDGQPIVGGADIDESDRKFIATIYPKPAPPVSPPQPQPTVAPPTSGPAPQPDPGPVPITAGGGSAWAECDAPGKLIRFRLTCPRSGQINLRATCRGVVGRPRVFILPLGGPTPTECPTRGDGAWATLPVAGDWEVQILPNDPTWTGRVKLYVRYPEAVGG
jgi:hypothetical protein